MNLRARLRDLWVILKATATEWSEDNASRLAASLAFYTVLSLAPLVLVSIAIAGLVLGEEAARGHLSTEVSTLIGPRGAEAIETILENAQEKSQGVIAAVVGAIVLLFGASGVFGELQTALDTIWEVQPKSGRGIWGVIRDRFASFSMVVGVGFLLLVSLVIAAVMTAMTGQITRALGDSAIVAHVLHVVVSLAMSTGIFALIYKVVPDARVEWRDVWIGAFATALFFNIGKFLISIYLGRSSVASSYGAAGSLVVVLIWVYYSAQVLFFGAELTQVWATRYGQRIKPSKGAIALNKVPRAPLVEPPPGEPVPPREDSVAEADDEPDDGNGRDEPKAAARAGHDTPPPPSRQPPASPRRYT